VSSEKKLDRKPGDEWTDDDDRKWRMDDTGTIWRVTNLDYMDDIQDYVTVPTICPVCMNKMGNPHLDKKMWTLHKMCFNCVVDMEHKIRVTGKFDEYEQMKVLSNKTAWLKDIKAELTEYLGEDLSKKFVNTDGSFDKWEGDDGIKNLVQRSIDEIEEFEKETKVAITELQEEINNVD